MSYRWPTMPNTGEADVWKGVSGVVSAGTDVYNVLEDIKAENQIAEFKRRTSQIDLELADQIEREPDSDKYKKFVQEADARKSKHMPTSPRAQRFATQILDAQKQSNTKLLYESQWRREKQIQADRIEADRRSIVINVGEELSGIEDAAQANKRLNELIKAHQLTSNEQNEVKGRMASAKVVQKEAKEARDNDVTNEVVTKLQEMDPETVTYINQNVEDAVERDKWLERFRTASERRLGGENIITNERERGRLLDLAASIAWPERQVKIADVLRQANIARYDQEIIDDAAYNEVRDAIRMAQKDEHPFAGSYIETTIGELMTGAPSSALGVPLPMLRTREDYMRYAINKFGRFTTRIPGVMDVINAKFPPPAENAPTEAAPDNPAYDYDGESIGYYNKDGSITLNKEGVKRLFELAGQDVETARDMARTHRYIIPSGDKE